MSDLIRKEDVKKFICANCVCKKLDEPCDGDCAMLRNIDNMQTVNAVKVVRCAECRYYIPEEKYAGRVGKCCKYNRDFPMRNDGFCSMGVKKEERTHVEEFESKD